MADNLDPLVERLNRLRNDNDDKVDTLIDYLKMIHPKYMDGDRMERYNYNPEDIDKRAANYFVPYGIDLNDLTFDKIMNEFQRQDENKNLSFEQKHEIHKILNGYLSKEQRKKRYEKIQSQSSGGKKKKKSKRKNSKKRSTKKNKK